ncbi:MAG: hypothetical protein M1814_005054 [Vezdaea aestivalis]|nr:MAG: hypothetical protein M1814_005054 [Vezdaea aestivalis]
MAPSSRCTILTALLGLAGEASLVLGAPTNVPTVDLGYVVHTASISNSSDIYTFSNIRYANPPIKDNRFAPPLPPYDQSNEGPQNGTIGNICPQAVPTWFSGGFMSLGEAAASVPMNQPIRPPSEDCLFLDVTVPKKYFEGDHNTQQAPVLIWIHGGGFFFGDKLTNFPPAGLIQAGNENVIFVAMNYRLGAFGFLPATDGSTANLGLLDQQYAIQWVQSNIEKFGGNGSQITIMGESAGGASVLYHIGAYAGRNSTANSLFQHAIAQSPAISNITKPQQQLATKAFFDAANITNIKDAINAPSEVLMAANAKVITDAPFGSTVFGPVIDGDLIPELPAVLFQRGTYNKALTVMGGNNANEGELFTPPEATNETAIQAVLKLSFPLASNETLGYINTQLYPPVYNGTYPWKTPKERVTLLIAEFAITCNVNYLGRSYLKAYDYVYSVPPAIHASDLSATFYAGVPIPFVNTTVATTMQGYFTEFARTGNPNKEGLPEFPVFGDGRNVINFSAEGIVPIPDPNQNDRCKWWQNGYAYQ